MDGLSLSQEQCNQQVSAYWMWVAKRQELGYWNIPGWTEHQNILGFDHPNLSWLETFNKELIDKGHLPGHALSLGCGGGSVERTMIKEGFCKSIEGCDISPGLIEIAQEAAQKEGMQNSINYYCADLNEPDFPREKYDIIIGSGIFHHVVNLEELFQNLAQALKPNGKLLMYDYVGPSRFQWTSYQMERCNGWLDRLPDRFKKKKGYPFYYYLAKRLFDCIPFAYSPTLEDWIQRTCSTRILTQFLRLRTAEITLDKIIPPHPDQFLVTDPSEAVRSGDIMTILNKYFSIDRLVPQGGSLVAPIFARTVANFIGDQEGEDWAQQILKDERESIQQGMISSDLIALVAGSR